MNDAEDKFAAEMRRRSRSFDAWALDCDRYRPTYPQALFDHIVSAYGDDGTSVEVLGRTGLRYTEDGRSCFVDSESA